MTTDGVACAPPSLPSHMTASILTSTRVFSCEQVPVPVPGPTEVLVEVLATGVCGSDLATYRGLHPYKRPPVVLGHELCGVVRGTGSRSPRRPGELVAAMAYAPCGRCESCAQGATNLCRDRRNLSHEGWDGSFAQYVLLDDAQTFVLPADTPPELGALVEPLAIAHHAVSRLDVARTRTLAILGTGGIGLSSLVVAKALGIPRVVCVDRGRAASTRALGLGASHYVDAATDPDVSRAVVEALGEEADATLVASGHVDVLDQAAGSTRPGGRVVVVSYFGGPHAVHQDQFVMKEIDLLMSNLCTADDVHAVRRMLASETIAPAGLVTHRFGLGELDVAMDLMDSSPSEVGKILILPRQEVLR